MPIPKEEVIRIAREAGVGLVTDGESTMFCANLDQITKAFELVAECERALMNSAKRSDYHD